MMSADKCKISIVLPTYNGERWLGVAIESVLNQTEKDWELIIVNDCSSDASFEIAMSYACKDKRIRVISNETNKKLPVSLNVGFELAVGEYLTWTSDDNILKPEMLEKLSAYLDSHPNVDLISMNYDLIDEDGNVIRDFEDQFPFERNAASLLLGCNVGAAFMYRRQIAKAVGSYDTSLFCAEDFDYWCRIALAGEIAYTDDNVYQYRDNPNSLSVTKRKQVREKTLLIKKKYSESFFDRFDFTELDKARFWSHVSFGSIPVRYLIVTLLMLFYTLCLKVLLVPFSSNKRKYKRIRNHWGFDKNYSFSVVKRDLI